MGSPVITATAALLARALTRRCPRCKKKQLVSASQRRKNVACVACGTMIPPQATKRASHP